MNFAASLEALSREAYPAIIEAIDSLPTLEAAALAYDWPLWARDKQIIPDTSWRSCGFLTGRGFGKTRSIAEHIQVEVCEERARRIALIAQNEDKTREVLVDGEAGLIATSPPWFRARWEKNRLVWPNGAQAFVYTPEVPGALRGPEHDLAWASEVVVWPAAQRDEAFSNLQLGLRLGLGRMLWDSTPKRRHPLIRYLLDRSRKHPDKHIVIRGSTRENADNLTPEALEEWETEYGGTQRAREELEGEFLDESDGALVRDEWIRLARRDAPGKLLRRVISVDPAISMRAGTDATGIIDLGLGVDIQVHVLADLSGRHAWEAWGALVVDRYFEVRADCVVCERNRGGDAVAANLRACAAMRGIRVVVLGDKDKPQHQPGVIFVREVIGRGSKQSRAEPVATMYERGRISHTNGVDLSNLEDELTTWEPGPGVESPNALDALVHGVYELADLAREKPPDPRVNFDGIGKMAEELRKPLPSGGSVANALLRRGGRGDVL
jgi:phage terminase large subunit-like protein